jgi:DnaJ-class molecular chaperone
METFVNYYHILGVSYHASFSEIKEAYRKKVQEVHPDKKDGNAELFKRVKEAYEVLKNSEKRKIYDERLFKPAPTGQTQQATSFQTGPKATAVKIRKNNRKMTSLSSLTLNAAFVLIGVLGNAYFNRHKK